MFNVTILIKHFLYPTRLILELYNVQSYNILYMYYKSNNHVLLKMVALGIMWFPYRISR